MNLPPSDSSDVPPADPTQRTMRNADPLEIDLGDEELELKVDVIAVEPDVRFPFIIHCCTRASLILF